MDDEEEYLWRNLSGASDYEDSDEIDSETEYMLYSQIHYGDNSQQQSASKKTLLNKSDDVIEISSTTDVTSEKTPTTDTELSSNVIEIVSSSDDEIQPYQIVDPVDVIDKGEFHKSKLARFFTDDSDKQCRNCRKLGHTQKNCPEPFKLPPCYACASRSHQYRDCPYKINMGKPRWNMECGRCRRRGHMTSQCPDSWRQFRWTTTPGLMVIPTINTQPPQSERCCCNCGRMGHLAHDCRQRTMFNKIISNPFVRTFDKHTDEVRSYESPQDLRNELTSSSGKKRKKDLRKEIYPAKKSGEVIDLRDKISPKPKKSKKKHHNNSDITEQFNKKFNKEKNKIQQKFNFAPKSKYDFAPSDVRRSFPPKDGKVKKKKFKSKNSGSNVNSFFSGSDGYHVTKF